MKCITNRLWAGLVITVISFSFTGCGGGDKTDITPPVITSAHADLPFDFDFSGGKIGLYATITDNTGVSRVFANVVRDGVESHITWLTVTSGSVYGATGYTIPGNTTTKDQSYSLHVWAQDNQGNITESTTPAFTVPPAGNTTPPPVPDI